MNTSACKLFIGRTGGFFADHAIDLESALIRRLLHLPTGEILI